MRDSPNNSPSIRARRAFTLVEISVVVTLLGLLVAMALPAYRHVTLQSKAAALVNDVRVFATAFQTYSTQKGGWPTTGTPGVVPPEIADAMSAAFSKPTPIGGMYEWDYNTSANGFHVTAAITVVSTGASPMTDDVELIDKVDQLYDDGNTATGNVQLGATNTLVFILEPCPRPIESRSSSSRPISRRCPPRDGSECRPWPAHGQCCARRDSRGKRDSTRRQAGRGSARSFRAWGSAGPRARPGPD